MIAKQADRIRVMRDFENFYASILSRRIGERVRSSALLHLYHSWADAVGACSIHHGELHQLMSSRGHRRLRSNGMLYLDVAVAQRSLGDAAVGHA